ncbi:MAG: hypothetical protein HOO96_09580 [Polyangiaceae bacterium]|nr:hypothetical protein [Polyangiaceae bacterium]
MKTILLILAAGFVVEACSSTSTPAPAPVDAAAEAQAAVDAGKEAAACVPSGGACDPDKPNCCAGSACQGVDVPGQPSSGTCL